MPKRKKTKKSIQKKVTTKKEQSKVQSHKDSFQSFSGVKLNESYISLFLGALVVVIFAVILFLFLKGSGDFKKVRLNLKNEQPMKEAQMKMQTQKTYTVIEGEGLFEIAEKLYGNGDYWINIANANNLSNPDQIETGMKLIIPEIKK